MSLQEAMFLGVGGQVGSGWLFAPLAAAAIAGPAVSVSWVIGGVLITLIALTWMELSAALPRSGAIVRYPHITHGGLTGWIMGWSFWLATISLPAIEAEAAVTYFGGQFQSLHLLKTVSGQTLLTWPNGILVGFGVMVGFFLLNNFGIGLLGKANKWITWWKIVIPALTFIGLMITFDGSNYTSYGGFTPTGPSEIFQAVGLGGIAFAMMGFRQALDFGGEIRNPQRNIPLATMGIIIIPVLIYLLIQIGFIGAINWSDIGIKAGDWTGLAGSNWGDGPLVHAFRAAPIALLGAFAVVLLIDAVIAPTGAGWIYLGASIRVTYGLSVNGYLPAVLRRNNRWGIPGIAAVASLIIGCVFFIPAPSWYRLVGFITDALVMSTIMGGVMLPIMRRCYPSLKRPFHLRGAIFWAPISFLAGLIIMYWAGFETLVNFFTAVILGACVYTFYYAPNKGWMSRRAGIVSGAVFFVVWIFVANRGGWVMAPPSGQRPDHWPIGWYLTAFWVVPLAYAAAIWLLSNKRGRTDVIRSVWLLLMMTATVTLSYFGEYGPRAHKLGFPWGTLIEIGIGLAVYYWAVASGYRRGGEEGAAEGLSEPAIDNLQGQVS
jgi:amino acid transporter